LKPHGGYFPKFRSITPQEALDAVMLVTVAKVEMDQANRIAKTKIENNPIAILNSDNLKKVIDLLEDDEYLAFSGATISIGEFSNAKCIFADQRDLNAPVAPGAMHFNGGRTEYRFNREQTMAYLGGAYDLHSEILDPSITANYDGLVEENLYLLPDSVVVPYNKQVNHTLAYNIVASMYDKFQEQSYSCNCREVSKFDFYPAKQVRKENQWELQIDWEGIAKVARHGHIFVSGKQGFDLSYFRSMKFDCKIEDFVVVSMEMLKGKPLNHRIYAYELNDDYQVTTRILGCWQSAKWHPNTDRCDTTLKRPATGGFQQAMDFLGILA